MNNPNEMSLTNKQDMSTTLDFTQVVAQSMRISRESTPKKDRAHDTAKPQNEVNVGE